MSGALAERGAALLDEGRVHDAVEVLRRAVAAGEPAAPDLLIRAYLDSGHWHCVVDWLGPLVEQGAAQYASRLAAALVGLGDLTRACDLLQLAVTSGDLAAANDLAILLHDKGHLTEAVQLLTDAAEAGDPHAGANLAAVLLESGDLRHAAEAAEKYLHESRPDTFAALGDVRATQGRDGEAIEHYERAIELGAVRGHTAYAAFLLDVRDDADGAEREYRNAARRREPGWAATLGRFLVELGRPDEAREYLQHALDHGDVSVEELLILIDGEDPYED